MWRLGEVRVRLITNQSYVVIRNLKDICYRRVNVNLWEDHAVAKSPPHPKTAHPKTAHPKTAQHSTAQHSTAQHSTAQHSTARVVTKGIWLLTRENLILVPKTDRVPVPVLSSRLSPVSRILINLRY